MPRVHRLSSVVLVLAACAHETLPTLHVRGTGAPDVARGTDGDRTEGWFERLDEAIDAATPGTTVVVHGRIELDAQVQVRSSGRADAWITIVGDPHEPPVLDASRIVIAPPWASGPSAHDDGAITLRGVHHVVVRGLTIVESPSAAIAIHDSTDILVEGNHTARSFGSGIAAWDSDHVPGGSERIRIIGNRVTAANDVTIAPPWFLRSAEPPHEAISIGGVRDFEVAFNDVGFVHKEGIDVKETSRLGRVHHNHVHDAARQCLYVDAWFGRLGGIEVDHNLGERCRGAGLAISVEGRGAEIDGLEIHDNVLRDNLGSGILFGRWGKDGMRRAIAIHHNTIANNGHGPPESGRAFFWITGGMFLLSPSIERLDVRDNRLVDNRGFQIGYSDAWLATRASESQDIGAAFAAAHVVFAGNVTQGEIATEAIEVGERGKAARVREWAIEPAAVQTGAGARLEPTDVGPAAWRRERV